MPNHCIATTRAGASCRSFAIRESAYCIFHDPARAECRRLMQSNGGRAERSRIVAEADRLKVDFYEPGGLQAVIGHVIRLQLLGSLTSRQASQLTKLLALAVNNRRQLSDGEDQASLFDDTTRVLIEATELITDKLNTRDAVERTNAVADFGAKRQEYLKANETFAPRFAPRSPSYPRFR